MEDNISKLKNRSIVVTQVEEDREINFEKIKKFYENYLTALENPTRD